MSICYRAGKYTQGQCGAAVFRCYHVPGQGKNGLFGVGFRRTNVPRTQGHAVRQDSRFQVGFCRLVGTSTGARALEGAIDRRYGGSRWATLVDKVIPITARTRHSALFGASVAWLPPSPPSFQWHSPVCLPLHTHFLALIHHIGPNVVSPIHPLPGLDTNITQRMYQCWHVNACTCLQALTPSLPGTPLAEIPPQSMP